MGGGMMMSGSDGDPVSQSTMMERSALYTGDADPKTVVTSLEAERDTLLAKLQDIEEGKEEAATTTTTMTEVEAALVSMAEEAGARRTRRRERRRTRRSGCRVRVSCASSSAWQTSCCSISSTS